MARRELAVGTRVVAGDDHGAVRYIGRTNFGREPRHWIGIELDEPVGDNDGRMFGRFYFQCRPNHGVFVKKHDLMLEHPHDTKMAHGAPAWNSSQRRESTPSTKQARSASRERISSSHPPRRGGSQERSDSGVGESFEAPSVRSRSRSRSRSRGRSTERSANGEYNRDTINSSRRRSQSRDSARSDAHERERSWNASTRIAARESPGLLSTDERELRRREPTPGRWETSGQGRRSRERSEQNVSVADVAPHLVWTPRARQQEAEEDSTPPPAKQDLPPSGPRVVSVRPDDRSMGCPCMSATIVVTFDRPMDQLATESAFSLNNDGKIDGEITWSKKVNALTFSPTMPLSSLAVHTVLVTSKAQSADGEGHSFFMSTFTTASFAAILSGSDDDDAEPDDEPPTAQSSFMQTMDKLEVAEEKHDDEEEAREARRALSPMVQHRKNERQTRVRPWREEATPLKRRPARRKKKPQAADKAEEPEEDIAKETDDPQANEEEIADVEFEYTHDCGQIFLPFKSSQVGGSFSCPGCDTVFVLPSPTTTDAEELVDYTHGCGQVFLPFTKDQVGQRFNCVGCGEDFTLPAPQTDVVSPPPYKATPGERRQLRVLHAARRPQLQAVPLLRPYSQVTGFTNSCLLPKVSEAVLDNKKFEQPSTVVMSDSAAWTAIKQICFVGNAGEGQPLEEEAQRFAAAKHPTQLNEFFKTYDVIHRSRAGGIQWVVFHHKALEDFVIGAIGPPDLILARCTEALVDGALQPVTTHADATLKAAMETKIRTKTSCLAFARHVLLPHECTKEHIFARVGDAATYPTDSFTWLGFLSFKSRGAERVPSTSGLQVTRISCMDVDMPAKEALHRCSGSPALLRKYAIFANSGQGYALEKELQSWSVGTSSTRDVQSFFATFKVVHRSHHVEDSCEFVVYSAHDDTKYKYTGIYLGSPEAILNRCTYVLNGADVQPLIDHRDTLTRKIRRIKRQHSSVAIAFARIIYEPGEHNYIFSSDSLPANGMTWIGCVTLEKDFADSVSHMPQPRFISEASELTNMAGHVSMKVEAVYADNHIYPASEALSIHTSAVAEVKRACLLFNSGEGYRVEEELQAWAAGGRGKAVRAAVRGLEVVFRAHWHGRAIVVYHDDKKKVFTVLVVGDPKDIMTQCTRLYENNTITTFDARHRAAILAKASAITLGSASLGFAHRELPADKFLRDHQFSLELSTFPTNDLTWLGITELRPALEHETSLGLHDEEAFKSVVRGVVCNNQIHTEESARHSNESACVMLRHAVALVNPGMGYELVEALQLWSSDGNREFISMALDTVEIVYRDVVGGLLIVIYDHIHLKDYTILVAGPAEEVLSRCSTALLNGEPAPAAKVVDFVRQQLIPPSGQEAVGFARKVLSAQEFGRGFHFSRVSPTLPMELCWIGHLLISPGSLEKPKWIAR